MELRDFIEYAPRESAVVRAMNPDAWVTPELQMLRDSLHRLQVLVWQQTEDATKKPVKNYPEPIPLTQAEVKAHWDAQPPVAETLPVDEMREWLGWPTPESA